MCSGHSRNAYSMHLHDSAPSSGNEDQLLYSQQGGIPIPIDTSISNTDNNKDDSPDDDDIHALSHSIHFSPAEDKSMKEHDLKVQTFDALQHGIGQTAGMDNSNPFIGGSPKLSRRGSVIGMPHQMAHSFLHQIPGSGGTGGVDSTSEIGGIPTSSKDSTIPENTAAISEIENPSDDLIEFYTNVKTCLDLRHKYLQLSIQKDEMQNPKNQDDWIIYPPPPKPTYKSKNKFNQLPPEGPIEEEEKFDFEKCVIPEIDNRNYYFALNDEDVYQVYDKNNDQPIIKVPSLHDFYSDLNKITKISSDGPTKSFAFNRLQYLDAKWNMYYLLNEFEESKQSKRNPHRDFYNVRKVDTHIHHSACMNQKHLLRYIKYKLKTTADEEVIFRDGKVLTLTEVFESLKLTAYDLSIDTLDMHAHTDSFHRFDKFNLKYNPIGESRLREIFLKTDNFIQGKYLAELTGQVFDDLESSKYQMVELRISIYGRSLDEWDKLAAWIVDNKLFSHNVRWLIQIPRLYDLYKKNRNVKSYLDIMKNVFEPLFEVSMNPKSHPKLHVFLQRVIGFDSVDDESKPEKPLHARKYPPAGDWDSVVNPPYSYYLYYLYANITTLNNLRLKHKFNTFVLRPHCGEAGDPEHLISAFLTSYGISHGILLRKLPYIQYLYYLDQIGIAMSPLSNNALFLTYDKNPFYNFFKKGLNVSLSTDDPLQFSYTKEPLIEEYSVAAQIYKLSSVDMCELAKNSCLQSGWEAGIKKHWLGKEYMKGGVAGNNIEKNNVPDIRVNYRQETLWSELNLMNSYIAYKNNSKNDL
ncbi:AMD1 [[Candida] subhashii]|uniref:AMP deaminase n=1 Tax=[Candida] subhashii TaxID=561895 RepID=A0A8J5QT10_9ASCO|nr:AMD1 [[Candida] subhashii]KAG7664657.1 AMD1 [[Candida] subhashii]